MISCLAHHWGAKPRRDVKSHVVDRIITRVLLLLLAGPAALAFGQTSQPTTEPVGPPAPQTVKKKPTYHYLRYNDDFSYLAGPKDSYEPDVFDPIKNILLGDDVRLSLGGEIRGRFESVTHKNYGVARPTQDAYFLHRYYYHADFKYRELARIFVQGVSAAIEDHDGAPGIPNPEEHFDVHQMFADVRFLGEQVPLALRFGRQELNYGNERLVSVLDWANVRRTWDGVKLFWSDKTWDADVWYVKPVVIERDKADESDEEVDFYGAYVTYKGIPEHGVDAYFLAIDDIRDRPNANNRTGDLALYTLGGRLWGKTGPWDYDTELTGQWGKWAGDTIQAWSWSIDGGHTLEKLPCSPRIGAGFDLATGDENPWDGIHGTFNQLFPLGHKFFGFLDQVGRQNVVAQNVNVTLKPHKSVAAQIAYHTFWNHELRDALYNAGGIAVRRDPRGDSGHEVGHELDLTIKWQVDVHMSLLFGYSHMWTSDFIQGTGKDEDPDLFYVMYSYKF